MGVLELTVPWVLFHCRLNLNNSSPINTQEPLTQSPDKLFNSFMQGHKLSLTDCRHSGWCDGSIPWAAGRDMLGVARCCHKTAQAPQGHTSSSTLSWDFLYPRSIPCTKEGLKWEGPKAGTATVRLWAGAATGYFCELFRGDIIMKSLSPGGTSLGTRSISCSSIPWVYWTLLQNPPFLLGWIRDCRRLVMVTAAALPFQLLLPTTQINFQHSWEIRGQQ